jgi:hypothetical protein
MLNKPFKIDHDKILQDLDNDENNNFIKDMENLVKNNKNLNDNYDNYYHNDNDDNDDNDNKNENKNKNKFFKKYSKLIISLLVFMLLNNKSIIELIYYIPFVKDKIFLNLLIRTIIFGIILSLYKKLK